MDEDDEFFGAAGVDTFNGGAGIDVASYILATQRVVIDLGQQIASEDGFGSADNLISIENIVGSNFDDRIIGDNTNNNMLDGGAGNDTMFGLAGDDTLIGGDGDDEILGDWKNEYVSDGNDLLNGGNGNDRLFGMGGDDTLIGGAGTDRIDGGSGTDTVDYSGDIAGITVNLAGHIAVDGTGTRDEIISIEHVIGSNFNDTIFGDANTAILDGGDGGDIIYGLGGVDTLNGGAGNDFLYGDWKSEAGTDGNDIVNGGDGNDFISGGGGNDTLNGDAGVDILYGMSGDDIVNGGDGDDTLYGDWKNELGSDGNDTLDGGAGNDTIIAGAGDDTILNSAGNDEIYGGSGTDTVDYTNAGAAVVVSLAENFALDGAGGYDTLVGVEDVLGSDFNDRLIGLNGSSVLSGNGGNDVIFGFYGADTINGGDGNDILFGDWKSNEAGDGDDVINGGAGNDLLLGIGGNDTLNGGDGNDTLFYDGVDTYNGGSGFDILQLAGSDSSNFNLGNVTATSIEHIELDNFKTSGDVANEMTFNLGHVRNITDADTIYITGDVNDSVINSQLDIGDLQGFIDFNGITMEHYVRNGVTMYIQENLLTTSGSSLIGDGSDNTLTGTSADEAIFAMGGNDILDGNGGVDTLNGGDGDDTLYFDADDTLDGGAGTDTMLLRDGDNLNPVVSSNNLAGIDIIDLTNGGGANALSFAMSQVDNFADTNTVHVYGEVGLDTLTVTGIGANNFQGFVDVDGDVMRQYTRYGNDLFVEIGIINGDTSTNGIVGTSGDDTITGTGANDVILGEDGNDILDGGAGSDILQAGDGDDTLYFDASDFLYGNAGTDTLKLRDGDTIDPVVSSNNLGGIDIIDLTNGGAANTLSLAMSQVDNFSDNREVYIYGEVGIDVAAITQITNTHLQGIVEVDGDIMRHYNRYNNDLYVELGLLDGDTITSGILGTSGNDTLNGTANSDAILGRDGDDVIDGGDGADILDGGAGDDILYYDDLNDVLSGGTGFDTLRLETGDSSNYGNATRNDVDSIEAIDLANGAANRFTIKMSHIIQYNDDNDLYFTGDVGVDTVRVREMDTGTDFVGSVTINSVTYDHYNAAAFPDADIYIQQGLLIT